MKTKRIKGTPAGAVLANGILGWRPERRTRADELADRTRHHREMCPCDCCRELRAL
jgi:hypothetical protein